MRYKTVNNNAFYKDTLSRHAAARPKYSRLMLGQLAKAKSCLTHKLQSDTSASEQRRAPGAATYNRFNTATAMLKACAHLARSSDDVRASGSQSGTSQILAEFRILLEFLREPYTMTLVPGNWKFMK
jgi:hypothetical protein